MLENTATEPAQVAGTTGTSGAARQPLGRRLRVVAAPVATIVLVAAAWVTPKLTVDPFVLQFVPTVLVTLLAAMHVWLLLRVNLLSFASPPFMAVGGYVLALTAINLTSNAVVLIVMCLVVPALMALPLGLVLLRLRGTYFALVTFVLAQVVVLVIIIAEGPLGGSSGISGIPPATLGATSFAAAGDLVRFSVMVAVVGLAIAAVVSVVWRRHFAAIDENEPLAASLGLQPWRYKTLAFVAAAGVGGLAGLILINQLGNSHPDSFLPLSSVNHVAAAVIGGPSFLGPALGALLLSWLVHTFASQAQYSQLFLGVALILVTLFAKRGIAGLFADAAGLLRRSDSRDTGEQCEGKTARGPEGGSAPIRERRRHEIPKAAPVVLSVDDLTKSFGGVAAVAGVSLQLRAGEILGVIGPNGAGKTTLINIVAGAMTPSSGSVTLAGKDVTGASPQRMSRQGLARSYQQTSVFARATVRENFARAKAFSKRWISDEELDGLLCSTGLDQRLDDRAGDLPYGQQKLLGLLLPLATRPDVLLLDEPAAGLELSARGHIDELVDWAVERGSAVLLVEHDMDLVRRICPHLLVMDTGKPLAEGTPHDVLSNPDVITAYLGVAADDEEDLAEIAELTERSGDGPDDGHATETELQAEELRHG
jgi:ABC-type branched-subunit amino acid transport system ATPase component/ABC-type branched-subunit amino acid transport system permease subunit